MRQPAPAARLARVLNHAAQDLWDLCTIDRRRPNVGRRPRHRQSGSSQPPPADKPQPVVVAWRATATRGIVSAVDPLDALTDSNPKAPAPDTAPAAAAWLRNPHAIEKRKTYAQRPH